MKIDRNNYEIFFVEYLDGALPVEMIDDVLDFLQKNPDLAEELKGLEKMKLEVPNEVFPLKNSLKRSDLDMIDAFEETCIRSIEGDLSPTEDVEFKSFIDHNKEQKATYNLYRATISEPDPLIMFKKKEQLRKSKNRIIAPFWYAVAASIVLGVFFFTNTGNKTNTIAPETIAEVVDKQSPDKKNEVAYTQNSGTKNEVPLSEDLATEPTIRISNAKTEKVALAANNPTQNINDKEIEAQPISAEKIEPLVASNTFVSKEEEILDFERFQLATIKTIEISNSKDYSKYMTIKQLLALRGNELWSRVKSGELSVSVLKSLNKASDNKFKYSTTTSGKVKAIGYESKLLAVSIPISNE